MRPPTPVGYVDVSMAMTRATSAPGLDRAGPANLTSVAPAVLRITLPKPGRWRVAWRALQTVLVALRAMAGVGAGRLLGRGPGHGSTRALARGFQDLGGTFVKLGQLVGSCPGVFGETAATEFRACLDTGPPVPFTEVRAEVESTIGGRLADVFERFEEAPIGRASIAVVHRAVLRGGPVVAVKILRPDIERLIATDLQLMQPMLTFLAHRVGVAVAGQLLRLLASFREQVTEELDLRNEARAMETFRRLIDENTDFRLLTVPQPYPELSGSRVLIMEYLDGSPIDDLAALRGLGIDPRPLVDEMVRGWFLTTLRHGIFHGDVHAGNLLLLKDGRVGVIDWGIVGRLDAATHRFYRQLIRAGLGDEPAWDDVANHLVRFYGTAVVRGLGLSDAGARDFVRALFEPILTRPLGEVRLATMVAAVQGQLAKARGEDGGGRSWRGLWHRLRAQRRFHAGLSDHGGVGSQLDRNMFLLGKQIMYFERYGRMFLPDMPLLAEPDFYRRLVTDTDPDGAPAEPDETAAACAACGAPRHADAAFCSRCGARVSSSCPGCGAQLDAAARCCPKCGRSVGSTADAAPASGPVALPASFASGRYRVKRFLGEGGKKRVYLAHDTRLDRDVAISIVKVDALDQAGLARVRREARAMGRLGDHPHIVTVYDVGEEGSQPYIVSQYMTGGDLENLLAGNHRLPIERVLRIVDQVCQALVHVHAGGVIHRDLKPGNVWFTQDGVVKLGDFGLAATLDRSRITLTGTMLGTVAYMAPEQALGRPPEPRSDLYALGAMVYEMVTGRPPFLGDDAVAIVSQHLHTPPVAPSWHNPDVPRALETLILRLLAKSPGDRPPTAADVREALATIAEVRGSSERPKTADTNPLDRLAAGVFVGREREMKEVRAAVQSAVSGRGRLLLVGGEPGVGKTRIAEELATYAQLCNAQVLWGRCYEGEGAPAFWPWVQAIRAYVHDRDPASLASDMGSGAVHIAQAVSEVRDRIPGLPPPPIGDPEQARFRLFDSVATFLTNAANRQPLVLILDDVHWADKPSLLLLQFLARTLRDARILVVAIYRDTELHRHHPLAQSLAELSREQVSERMTLRGLSARDIARFIEMTAGVSPPDSLVDAVHRESEGNAFFLTEIVRLLTADGRLEHPEQVRSWSLIIPQGIRAAIGRRLDRLSEACNRALTVAAVIGREFGADVLGPVAEFAEDPLLALLEEAVAARVLGEVAGKPGRFTFSHALVRETLYEEVTLARRVRLHQQIALVLERLYVERLEPHLGELAWHFFKGARGGDVDKAIAYSVRAADRARTLLAHEEAVRLYQLALQALDLKASPELRERCELLLALGEAERKAGEATKAKGTLEQAAQIARTAGLREHLAHAALGLSSGIGAGVGVEFGVANEAVVGTLEEALNVLGNDESALRAQVLASLAAALYSSRAEDRRVALSREGVELARRSGNPAALAQALLSRHLALWGPGNLDERLAVATEIVELGEATGDGDAEFRGRVYRLGDLLESGAMQAAERERGHMTRLAVQLRQPHYAWWAAVVAVTRPLFDGRFDEVEALAQLALGLGQRAQDPNAAQIFTSQMFALRWAQGRLDEVEPFMRGFADQYTAVPAWRCVLALLQAELDRTAEARAEIERVATNGFDDFPFDLAWLAGVSSLAQACAIVGDARRAALLYQRLLPFAAHNIFHPAAICFGSVELPLGLLAATMRRWTDAAAHFEKALVRNTELGTPPFLARTLYGYATMLLARAQAGDREKALALVNDALETARELGMRALIEKLLALKLRAQGIVNRNVQVSIDAVVSLVERERPDIGRHAAPDGTVTILFTDIEGSTAMIDRLGDRRAQEVLRAHNAIVREQAAAHGGFEVKSQGDGFMLAFGSARRALLCAVALQRAFAGYNRRNPTEPIRVRIGLHTGEVIKEADDFFGRNVILSARIASEARGGEILASSVVKELTESSGDFRFGERLKMRLKGLGGSYAAHRVEWADAS